MAGVRFCVTTVLADRPQKLKKINVYRGQASNLFSDHFDMFMAILIL